MESINYLISILEKDLSEVLDLDKNNIEVLKEEKITKNQYEIIFEKLRTIVFNKYFHSNNTELNIFLNNLLSETPHEINHEYVYLYVLVMLSQCFKHIVNHVFSKNTKKFFEDFVENINRNTYCRGVANSNYDLIPSLYRNLESNKRNIIIDDDFIDDLYEKKYLKKLYEKLISDINNKNEFYSFMQHSLSYSPFLDVTKCFEVALSFATNFKSNINDYENNDAAIYVFEDEKIKCGTERKIQLIKNKIKVNDEVFNKKLYMCDLEDFIMNYSIINDMSNDRMKYQKGQFVNIIKAVIINNRLCLPNNQIVTKYVIAAKSKRYIYSYICEKYDEYRYEYLMNPYLYFGKSITNNYKK